MYEKFLRSNTVDASQPVNTALDINTGNLQLNSLFKECGGYNVRQGLFKIYDLSTAQKWIQGIGEHFPPYKNVIFPFASDWMCRQYASDRTNQKRIWMFDPATAKAYSLNTDINTFFNSDLVDELEETLSLVYFQTVMKILDLQSIGFEDCLGYSVPLFLGGKDTPSNFEKINMEVYWEFQLQIYFQVKDLPPGTKINSINFKKN